MEKISELRAKRAAKIDALAAQVAKMNHDGYIEKTEDQTSYDALKGEIAQLDAKIARAEEANRLQATAAQPVPGQSGIVMPPSSFRSGRLKFFKGADAEQRALRFGKFMQASVFGSESAAGWCRDNGIVLHKAQSEGVNSAGGYLVPEEFSAAIIDLRDDYGVFRRLARVMPMGRDTMTIPRRTGGLTAYAVGEAAAITASTASWDQVRLTAAKWGVLTLLSSELDEDAAVNIGDLLIGEIAYAFAVSEDTAGFTGDGSSTYHGIRGLITKFNDGLAAGANPLAGSVDAASNHDTFAEIDAADLSTLMAKLPQYVYVKGNPAFYTSQVGWALVFERLAQAAGGITKDQFTGRTARSYVGFPVEIIPSMPVSAGDLSDTCMLLFGDISMAATMGDRRGMTVARSTEYKFAEDQIAIKATERFDINIHDIGNATVAGPVVGLMGE